MSHISVKPDTSTTTEDATLTNLTALAVSGAGQFLRKTGVTTFENATPSGGGTITGSGIINTLTYWTDTSVIGSVTLGLGLSFSNGILSATGGGTGTVTSVSVVTANGVSGSVANATTTPAITLTLGAITPTTVNGNTITTGTGTLTLSTFTLTVAGNASISGTNTGDQTSVSGNAGTASAVAVGGITGLGTGVATALAINVGSAGAFVTFNGALGTPSSGTVTNLTGTASININGTVGATTPAAGTFTAAIANSFVPNLSTVPSNGLYLPAANTLGWAINSAAELQLTGTALSPAADGGSSLGTTALGWQNIFSNTGFVFNIENGDWVATHTAGILTVGTGDLRVTNAGANTASAVTVGGTQTLTNKTLTSPTLTTPSAFTTGGSITLAENTSIALDPAGSADGKYSGITVTATSGYTQAFGDLVYLDPTDSRWEATDANAASGADGDSRGMLGMVVVTGTDGNACTILLQGIIRADAKFPSFTINNPIYVSETAGLVTQTQPTTTDVVIRIVGAALTADEMYFNPDNTWTTHV